MNLVYQITGWRTYSIYGTPTEDSKAFDIADRRRDYIFLQVRI